MKTIDIGYCQSFFHKGSVCYHWSGLIPDEIRGNILLVDDGWTPSCFSQWLSHTESGLSYTGSIIEMMNEEGYDVYAMDRCVVHHLDNLESLARRIGVDIFMGYSMGGVMILRLVQIMTEMAPTARIILLSPFLPIRADGSVSVFTLFNRLFRMREFFSILWHLSDIRKQLQALDTLRLERPILVIHGIYDPITLWRDVITFFERVRPVTARSEMIYLSASGNPFLESESREGVMRIIMGWIQKTNPVIIRENESQSSDGEEPFILL